VHVWLDFRTWLVPAGIAFSSSPAIRRVTPSPPVRAQTSSHWQLDLNYTHNFTFCGDTNLQLRADLSNVFDRQTGHGIESRVNMAGFGETQRFYNPRRLQLAVKFQF
jgi:hypothetical protein